MAKMTWVTEILGQSRMRIQINLDHVELITPMYGVKGMTIGSYIKMTNGKTICVVENPNMIK